MSEKKITKAQLRNLLAPYFAAEKAATDAEVALQGAIADIYAAVGSERIKIAEGRYLSVIKRENKKKDEDGNTVVDEDGKSVVESTTYFVRTVGEEITLSIV